MQYVRLSFAISVASDIGAIRGPQSRIRAHRSPTSSTNYVTLSGSGAPLRAERKSPNLRHGATSLGGIEHLRRLESPHALGLPQCVGVERQLVSSTI